METKVDTHVNNAGASASTPASRQNSATLEPSLLYITPPIDSSKYSITYKESQHPYRKYIIEEDLFDVPPEPRAGQKHPVQSLVNAKTSSAPHSPIETHPKPGERRVTSADLEKLVSTARSFAFLAATRLGHRKDEEFGLVPHQIVTRHGRGEEDEVIRMINFTRTENYKENYTLENCTKACRLAVMHMIRTLEGALERYDTDPDILWSLLMHQSISFAWDSEKCLDLLQASLTDEDKATLASKWSPQEASYYTATAKETYHRRLDKERKKQKCTCPQVTLGCRSSSQRFKDWLQPRFCDYCGYKKSKLPSHWTRGLVSDLQPKTGEGWKENSILKLMAK